MMTDIDGRATGGLDRDRDGDPQTGEMGVKFVFVHCHRRERSAVIDLLFEPSRKGRPSGFTRWRPTVSSQALARRATR